MLKRPFSFMANMKESSKHLKRAKLAENKRRELCNQYDTQAGSEFYRLFELDLKEAVK
jgi:hypothetical protein